MGKIVKFKIKGRITRKQAINWLSQKSFDWDSFHGVSENIFHEWRFIRSTDGEVYFANCIDRGITKSELEESKNV